MQGTWRVYLISALLACVVAAATAIVTVHLLVPPATPSANLMQSSNVAHSANTMTVEGVADLAWGKELDVFYKVPFAAAPNLTFPEGLDQTHCHVVDQKAASFKLMRDRAGAFGPDVAKVKWKAEGRPAQ